MLRPPSQEGGFIYRERMSDDALTLSVIRSRERRFLANQATNELPGRIVCFATTHLIWFLGVGDFPS